MIPDPEGALGITLSWTNPTRTYGRGGTLESITKVEVYRDDELIKTFDSPAVGEAMTYHDDVAASDLYSPVTGEVLEVNEELEDDPKLINNAPLEAWIVKVSIADTTELDELMDQEAYDEYLATL